jgi:hypothetical protein
MRYGKQFNYGTGKVKIVWRRPSIVALQPLRTILDAETNQLLSQSTGNTQHRHSRCNKHFTHDGDVHDSVFGQPHCVDLINPAGAAIFQCAPLLNRRPPNTDHAAAKLSTGFVRIDSDGFASAVCRSGPGRVHKTRARAALCATPAPRAPDSHAPFRSTYCPSPHFQPHSTCFPQIDPAAAELYIAQ